MDLITVLPNLGIGVVAILTLGYVTREFISHLKTIHTEHKIEFAALHASQLIELKEREDAMRVVEREVRGTIMIQLSKNTQVMEQALLIMKK